MYLHTLNYVKLIISCLCNNFNRCTLCIYIIGDKNIFLLIVESLECVKDYAIWNEDERRVPNGAKRYRHMCRAFVKHVLRTYISRRLRRTRENAMKSGKGGGRGSGRRCRVIILRDEGGYVLSWQWIVLCADEVYVQRTSRKRDTRRAKLVKARSAGIRFPRARTSSLFLFTIRP